MKKLTITICSAFILLLATLQKSNAQNIYAVAGIGGSAGFSGDGGQATAAQLGSTGELAIDASGNIFIADGYRIRKINTSGIITTIAGDGTPLNTGDGGPATAAQVITDHVVAGPGGVLYISNSSGIRQIDASGIITTIAGTGICGYSGDGGPATAAQFKGITDIAVDAAGNLFVADEGAFCIRKINTSGIVTTIVGNGTYGYSGDGGPATAAQIDLQGIAVDASGNIYLGDTYNNVVRKVSASGIITRIAGTGTSGFSGDGGPATAAKFFTPNKVLCDAAGNVYISDAGNRRIRKVNTAGIITTIAGDGSSACTGNGGPATAAGIYFAGDIAFDLTGNLLLANGICNQVRRITIPATTTSIYSAELNKTAGLTIAPNPASSSIAVKLCSTTNEITEFIVTDVLGTVVFQQSINTNQLVAIQLHLPPGTYVASANTADGRYVQRVVVQ